MSGRAAFWVILARLAELGVTHVHLPSYLCESLLLPVQALGLEFSFYPVDRSLVAYPSPPRGAAVLLIHYFGWTNPAAPGLRSEAGDAFHLIEDFSQSMLSGEGSYCSAKGHAFFSARKFGPVPLGGWSSVPAPLAPCDEADAALEAAIEARRGKAEYLLDGEQEVDVATEERYLSAFGSTERFLEDHLECALPQKGIEIAAGLDWEEIARRRRTNWLYLKEALAGRMPLLHEELPDGVVPLGLAVLPENRNEVRKQLAKNRIFCPVHWPLPGEVPAKSFPEAQYLSANSLTIPIDQRYAAVDLDRVIKLLKGLH